jgi:GGDEF domain-containing protein
MVMATTGSYRHLDNTTLTVRAATSASTMRWKRRWRSAAMSMARLRHAVLCRKASRDFVAFLDTKLHRPRSTSACWKCSAPMWPSAWTTSKLVSTCTTAAFYDQLSKLPNRTRLVEILDATLTGPAREDATLSLVDLDHFAETNDALGHQFGDACCWPWPAACRRTRRR